MLNFFYKEWQTMLGLYLVLVTMIGENRQLVTDELVDFEK